jgi:hypothetical protein
MLRVRVLGDNFPEQLVQCNGCSHLLITGSMSMSYRQKIDAEFLLVTVIEDLHFLKDQIKCCRRDRLQYQPSSAAPQPSGLHPNDILVNIKLSPYTGLLSMYDLLQEFQSLTNAHRLADYAQYTLHLLHSSFPMYFGAEFRGSKLKKSPEYQASIVEDERQRLKKERQAALLAKFSAQ